MSKTAGQLIEQIDGLLPKWRTWFPSEESEVEIPRCHLITLIEAARVGVAAAKMAVECPTCSLPKSIAEAVMLAAWECPRCGRATRFPAFPATLYPSSAPAAATEPGSGTRTAS